MLLLCDEGGICITCPVEVVALITAVFHSIEFNKPAPLIEVLAIISVITPP
jgi:hypothetical protein